MKFIALCVFASLGGFIAKKLKIPSALLIGSLIFASIWNIFIAPYTFPPTLKLISKIVAGVLVGMRIENKDFKSFGKLIKPLSFLVLGMFSYTLLLAFLIYKFAGVDLNTALFACTPGGLSDMTLIAESYGANVPQVVLIQTIRLISIICIFPPLCMFIMKKNNGNASDIYKKTEKIEVENKFRETLSVFSVATVGGILGAISGAPAGELLGSMFCTIGFRFMGKTGYMPPKLKNALQITIGVMIGATLTKESAMDLLGILDVALISVFFVIGFGFFMGFVLHKVCKIDLVTAIFGCAPGGVQEMVVIADDLNANISTVTTLQVFRLVTVLTFFPLMIQIIVKIAG
ncbi:MAG: AbrB family transcriptional regulator [Clostridia bacterium]